MKAYMRIARSGHSWCAAAACTDDPVAKQGRAYRVNQRPPSWRRNSNPLDAYRRPLPCPPRHQVRGRRSNVSPGTPCFTEPTFEVGTDGGGHHRSCGSSG